MFKESCQSANLGFGVTVGVEDSSEGPRYEIFANAILAKPAPFNVTKKNMTHRVEESSQCHSKMFIEVGLPAVLEQSRYMAIEPSPSIFFGVGNRWIDPMVLNEPSHSACRVS